jgi:hypothetical protein
MKVTVTQTNIRQGNDVLKLLQAFTAAGIPTKSWGSALKNLTEADAGAWAHTDMVPIKISGKVYPVMDVAAGTVGNLASQFIEWGAESHVDFVQPTIAVLTNLLSKWQAHNTVRIHRMDNGSGWVEVSTQHGHPDQAAGEAFLLALAAVGLWNEDTGRLMSEDMHYIPA